MTTGSMFALFGAMLLLALIPGVSVIMVTARSAASGFAHGVSVAAGIVAGDIVFILVAIYGLALLADVLGSRIELVQIIGGAYLLWLGAMLWRTRPDPGGLQAEPRASLLSSFLAGLSATLADHKAILFYLGFFPAFLDLNAVSLADTLTVLGITIVAVGGAKTLYAFLAARASQVLQSTGMRRAIATAASVVLITTGVILIAR